MIRLLIPLAIVAPVIYITLYVLKHGKRAKALGEASHILAALGLAGALLLLISVEITVSLNKQD